MTGTARVHYKSFIYDSARWDGFELRPDDIVISTPPKCGTTWMQRICALLVFQTPDLEQPLTTISPWLDMLTVPREDVVADLEAQRHRRFIKTHTPFDGLPFDERVTYLCVGRDPRDVALSWDGHVANTDIASVFAARAAAVGNDDIAAMVEQGPPPLPESERERFWAFVMDPTPATEAIGSLLGVLHHLATFWAARDRANVVMLHYDDLKADLERQMRALAARVGIPVPEARWPELVHAASFEEMRRHADRFAPGVTESIWLDSRQFFRRGTSGQWRDLFEDGDDARYEARVRELASPDLAAWVHHTAAAR
jgi:aryl sulfotransferase